MKSVTWHQNSLFQLHFMYILLLSLKNNPILWARSFTVCHDKTSVYRFRSVWIEPFCEAALSLSKIRCYKELSARFPCNFVITHCLFRRFTRFTDAQNRHDLINRFVFSISVTKKILDDLTESLILIQILSNFFFQVSYLCYILANKNTRTIIYG